jgi:hypothetical protein
MGIRTKQLNHPYITIYCSIRIATMDINMNNIVLYYIGGSLMAVTSDVLAQRDKQHFNILTF